MPLTPNGVSYTEEMVTPVDDLTRVWVPDHVQDATDVTLVIVAHGWGGGNGHMTSPAVVKFPHGCVDRGHVVACGDLHGDSWANPTAMGDMAELHAWADARWNVTHVVYHGTSAGVLTSAVAAGRGVLPNLAGMVLIDGVLNPQQFYGQSTSAATSMNAAWGTTDATSFAAAIVGHDPVNDPATNWANIPIFMAASPNDVTVRKTPNSDEFYARLTTPGVVTYTATTGGHVTEGNFLHPQALAWLDTIAPAYSGGTSTPPPDPPPPSGGSSNLRTTDGTPVLVKATDGTTVVLQPASPA